MNLSVFKFSIRRLSLAELSGGAGRARRERGERHDGRRRWAAVSHRQVFPSSTSIHLHSVWKRLQQGGGGKNLALRWSHLQPLAGWHFIIQPPLWQLLIGKQRNPLNAAFTAPLLEQNCCFLLLRRYSLCNTTGLIVSKRIKKDNRNFCDKIYTKFCLFST